MRRALRMEAIIEGLRPIVSRQPLVAGRYLRISTD
jgi:hypothetical protein